jgi:hypothetical protein
MEDPLAPLEDPTAPAADRSARSFRSAFRWLLVAAGWELALLVALLLLIDWSERAHVLILVATLLGYGTVVLAGVALAAYVRASALRVLAGVEMLEQRLRS